jgi:hypothetical protein
MKILLMKRNEIAFAERKNLAISSFVSELLKISYDNFLSSE